jgi:hypothetical protein
VLSPSLISLPKRALSKRYKLVLMDGASGIVPMKRTKSRSSSGSVGLLAVGDDDNDDDDDAVGAVVADNTVFEDVARERMSQAQVGAATGARSSAAAKSVAATASSAKRTACCSRVDGKCGTLTLAWA